MIELDRESRVAAQHCADQDVDWTRGPILRGSGAELRHRRYDTAETTADRRVIMMFPPFGAPVRGRAVVRDKELARRTDCQARALSLFVVNRISQHPNSLDFDLASIA